MTRDLTPRCRAVEEEEEGDGTHGLTARWRLSRVSSKQNPGNSAQR